MMGFVWDHFFFEADAAPLTFAGVAMLLGVPLALTDTTERLLQKGAEYAGSIATSVVMEFLVCMATAQMMTVLLFAAVGALVVAVVALCRYPDGAL